MHLRLTFSGAALMVAALALSQGSTPFATNKRADRTLRAPAPVVDSTLRFSPQIKEVTGQLRMEEVENKFNMNVFNLEEPNTLIPGSMSSTPSPIAPLKKWPAIGATGWVPPDPDVAIGPNFVVATVNVAIAFFRKDGTKLFEQDLGANGFFSNMGVTSFVFDPKCFYDKTSGRFFVVALEMDDATKTSKALVAVSDDSDPTGTWFKYRIEAKQTVDSVDYWMDYPGFGFNKDAVMVTGNMFGFAGGFNGIQYILIPKAALLTGGQPTISYFTLGGGSVQVSRTVDGTVDKLYAINWTGGNTAMVHAIKDILTTPTLSTTPVAIPSFQQPAQAAQSTGGHTLDSLDGRIMNAHVRFGRLYAAHTIRKSGSDPTNVSRWYEINLNGWPDSGQTPALRQAGNVGLGGGQHSFMPAIGVNSLGEIAIVYTRSSSSICADFVASARRPSDPLGGMGSPIMLSSSVGSIYGGSSNRWGDYFGCQVDPVDDKTFWGIGMIANASGGWQTIVQSFKVTTPVSAQPTGISKLEGGTTTGSLSSILASDGLYYTLRSVPIARTGEVSSAIVTFTAPSTNMATLGFTFESAAATNVTASYFIWNWTTSTWTYVGATPQTSTDKVWSFNVGGPYSNYINASKQVKILLRSIMPYNPVRNAIPYTFKIDQVKLTGSQ